MTKTHNTLLKKLALSVLVFGVIAASIMLAVNMKRSHVSLMDARQQIDILEGQLAHYRSEAKLRSMAISLFIQNHQVVEPHSEAIAHAASIPTDLAEWTVIELDILAPSRTGFDNLLLISVSGSRTANSSPP